jgi:hypothetical protein
VFASLLDRPLVPPTMLVLWLAGIIPGTLALAFAFDDGSSFLWTLSAWRAEARAGIACRGEAGLRRRCRNYRPAGAPFAASAETVSRR